MKQGWEVKKLTEIAEVSTGKWDASHANENSKYRFYTCAYDYLLCDTKRFFGECLILPGNGVNVGEVFYYDGEFDAYQRTYVISNIKLLPKYLHYHMLLFWKKLGTKKQYGSATNFIKIGNFQDYDVEFPQEIEQQRIVAILDEAFTAIEGAKANAVQNLKNAKELFDSYLQSVFENRGEGWEEQRLGEILINQPQNGWSPPAKNQSDSGIPVLTLSAVTGFVFNPLSVKYTSALSKPDARYWVNNGDLLITRSNTPELVGHVAICSNINEPTIYPDLIMKINPKEKIITTEFLFYQLKSPKLREIIKEAAHGANPTMKKINKTDVQNFKICYPLLFEQEKIIQKLDLLSAETKRLEAIYQQKIECLEELKKSILQKAFNGELG
jgi:type I restriction enzyme S subunit